MSRTVIVGDVHGCLRELHDLLACVGMSNDDRLYFVGDLIGRGPDTLGVLELVRKLRAIAVCGNHEIKLLEYERAKSTGGPPVRLGPGHHEIAKEMKKDHWQVLRNMPLWHDLPEHDVRIVHAGVVPGLPVENTDASVLTTMRALTTRGEPSSTRGGDFWGRRYQGPPHVVFGHNALMHPQIHPWATGIDLGCVYGGFLAALVLEQGMKIPNGCERQDLLVTVPARRAYYPPRAAAAK